MHKDITPVINNYKQIHDSIHGYINLSNIAVMIIDTAEFQRMRRLKQLGSCCYIFHNAVHTRHEHSIGTYHVAGKLLDCIAKNTCPSEMHNYLADIPELKYYLAATYGDNKYILDDYIIELVKIGALCHDLGHGPFSHVFDDFFLPSVKKVLTPNDSHEVRSCIILEKIIKANKKLNKYISDNELSFIKNIINPSNAHSGFIYQIVSNNLNGLDVDKFDYIVRDSYVTGIQSSFNCQRLVEHVRVIDNVICYPEQSVGDIIELYTTRYKLHKNVYSHKSVIAAQFMIIELFKYLDKIINICDSVNNMDLFCKLTDDYILNCSTFFLQYNALLNKNQLIALSKADNIIKKLNSHDIYKHVATYVGKSYIDITRKDITVCAKSDILIYRNIIGFVSGNKNNPLNNIYVYNTKNLIKNNKLQSYNFIINNHYHVIPTNHQEYVTMIFYKHKKYKIVDLIKSEFNRFIAAHNTINNTNSNTNTTNNQPYPENYDLLLSECITDN